MDVFKFAFENDVSSLQQHIDFIGIKDARGKSLLHHAVLGSSIDVIEYLMNQDIDLNQKDQLGETAIFDCARKAKINIAKRLLSKYARVDIKNNRDETLLHLASHKGNMDMVRLLVEHQADLNAVNFEGRLPIHYAILAGHMDVVLYLIEQSKISYFHLDSNQDSFLHYAARTTNVKLVEHFLEHKLNPNLLNDHFETPLFNAVRAGSKDVIQCLLKYDAYIEVYNRRYETPINLAKYNEDKLILKVLTDHQQSVLYNKLISHQTLAIAVLNRDHTKLRTLIETGHLMHKDRLKMTAFDYAQYYKLSACVNVLRPIIQ